MDLDKEREHLPVLKAEEPEECLHKSFKKDEACLDEPGKIQVPFFIEVQGDDDKDKRCEDTPMMKRTVTSPMIYIRACHWLILISMRVMSVYGLFLGSGRDKSVLISKGGLTTPCSVMIALTSFMGVASNA